MTASGGSGRLNLPFVGHCTFGKYPAADWERLDPEVDVAVIGAPFDSGTQYRPGARFGPRAVREASTLFAFGHGGAYDFEDDILYLPAGAANIADAGDADIIHADTEQSHANIEAAVIAVLKAGATPAIIGGDHSVTIPALRAFDGGPPLFVVQIDAHLDFVDERHGVRCGHGSPIRRASEMDHVQGILQMGIRNVSSSRREDYDAARAAGSQILSVRDVRRMGAAQCAALVPEGANVYCTIDIDGFDPSIAPGTGTPSHGGFLYYEVLEFLKLLCARCRVAGLDIVEVAPAYDPAAVTATLAAQLLLNFLGAILHNRSKD